jgi:RNA polymerase sigma factor (sigma-70 family)
MDDTRAGPARLDALGPPDNLEQVNGTGGPGSSSFDSVYSRERPALTRLAYLLVRSIPVAEELAQEAFVRLYERFDTVENPAGFLRTTVVRLGLRWMERHDMERRRLAVAGAALQLDGEPEVDETWDALGRLRPERRAVLVLRFYEDMSHEQVAQVLRCSAGTVRSRTRRALADLRKEITDDR